MTDELYQENGSGTYRNLVIPLDYSDPDVIRVEENGISHFYYVASSFMDVLGVPVLHSGDLLNWEIVGYAVSDFPEELEHYSSERMEESVCRLQKERKDRGTRNM